MIKKTTLTIFAISITLSLSSPLLAQSDYDHHSHGHKDGHHHDPESKDATQSVKKAKLVTGQGDFVFSWDQELTAAFPKDAVAFEPNMHGGFNEDPETGIVYTGIPGYGLCSISPDLTKWTTIGSDERLKDNIHASFSLFIKDKNYLRLHRKEREYLC